MVVQLMEQPGVCVCLLTVNWCSAEFVCSLLFLFGWFVCSYICLLVPDCDLSWLSDMFLSCLVVSRSSLLQVCQSCRSCVVDKITVSKDELSSADGAMGVTCGQ